MLEINHLSQKYGRKQILSDINLSVGEHECIGIIGANGCGKTTLLSILAGVSKQAGGTVNKSNDTYIGYVPQDNPLISDLSVYDNLLLWYKGSRKAFKEVLKSKEISMLGINDYIKKPAGKLSGGMKKKVSIAIALINNSNLLILDEPSAALDLKTKEEIDNYLLTFKKEKGSIIITTHEEAELLLCDRLFIVKKGVLNRIPSDIKRPTLVSML